MTTPPSLSAPSRPPARSWLRRTRRAAALAVPAAALLPAAPAAAAPPQTWPDPPDMSLLQALLIYGGIPLAIMLLVTLLVMAPSLIRGDRQQRGVSSWTEPQWFGGPRESVPAGRHAVHEVGPAGQQEGEGRPAAGPAYEQAEQPGGASARW